MKIIVFHIVKKSLLIYSKFLYIASNMEMSISNNFILSSHSAIRCVGGLPRKPINGQQIAHNNTFGSIVTYSCNAGYRLMGPRTVICMANGQWNGSQVSCEGKRNHFILTTTTQCTQCKFLSVYYNLMQHVCAKGWKKGQHVCNSR